MSFFYKKMCNNEIYEKIYKIDINLEKLVNLFINFVNSEEVENKYNKMGAYGGILFYYMLILDKMFMYSYLIDNNKNMWLNKYTMKKKSYLHFLMRITKELYLKNEINSHIKRLKKIKEYEQIYKRNVLNILDDREKLRLIFTNEISEITKTNDSQIYEINVNLRTINENVFIMFEQILKVLKDKDILEVDKIAKKKFANEAISLLIADDTDKKYEDFELQEEDYTYLLMHTSSYNILDINLDYILDKYNNDEDVYKGGDILGEIYMDRNNDIRIYGNYEEEDDDGYEDENGDYYNGQS